jgi:Cu/Ag efflux protein CusF
MSMKKTILMSMVALAVSIAFVSGVMAQQASTPAQPAAAQETKLEKFSGVIEKVDEATKDVLVQFHKEKKTFSVNERTKITEGSKELKLSDLKKGMWASVEYRKEGDKWIAESISFNMSKATAKKETPMEVKKEVKKENPSEKAAEKK